VISLLDANRTFDWAEHPHAAEIMDGIDPYTAPVDVMALASRFLTALREEVIAVAGQGGLFELTMVAGVEELKAGAQSIDAGVQDIRRRLGSGQSTYTGQPLPKVVVEPIGPFELQFRPFSKSIGRSGAEHVEEPAGRSRIRGLSQVLFASFGCNAREITRLIAMLEAFEAMAVSMMIAGVIHSA
jgi:hypothetical protein